MNAHIEIKAQERRELELLGVLGILRRHAGVVWASLGIALVVAIIALFALAPVYSTYAVIFVDPATKNVLVSENVLNTNDDARVDSELEMMATDAVLIRVIDELQLVNDPEFGVKSGALSQILALTGLPAQPLPTGAQALNEVLTNVRQALSIQRKGGTYVVNISAKAPSPEGAARLANSVARAYIAQQLEAKISTVLASRDAISGRMAEAEKAVKLSETAIDDFIDRQIFSLEGGAGAGLLDLRARLQQLEASTSADAATLEQASSAIQSEQWGQLVSTLRTDALAALEANRTALADQLRSAPTGDDAYFDLQAQLAEATQSVKSAAQTQIDSLQQTVAVGQQELTRLRTDLRDGVLKGPLSADALTNLYRLQKSAESSRTQYSLLLSRISELDAQASLQVPDSRIVSEALPPSDPSFPKPAVVLIFCLVAGLVFGCVLALLMDRYWGGFSSEDQLSQYGSRRVIATVPKVKRVRSPRKLLDALAQVSTSTLSESFQRMRVAIEQLVLRTANDDGLGKVIMVTSTAPGEGKSTVAIGLARSCALAGQRTILIDCDLRRPRILRYLGVRTGTTLDGVLRSTRPVSAMPMTIADPRSPADIIGASVNGRVEFSSTTTRERLVEVIQECRKHYDVVIFDTPPIGAVTDAAFLAPIANFVLYVVRWSSTPQNEVNRSVTQLLPSVADDAEMLFVLNGQPARRSAYGGNYASYYVK